MILFKFLTIFTVLHLTTSTPIDKTDSTSSSTSTLNNNQKPNPQTNQNSGLTNASLSRRSKKYNNHNSKPNNKPSLNGNRPRREKKIYNDYSRKGIRALRRKFEEKLEMVRLVFEGEINQLKKDLVKKDQIIQNQIYSLESRLIVGSSNIASAATSTGGLAGTGENNSKIPIITENFVQNQESNPLPIGQNTIIYSDDRILFDENGKVMTQDELFKKIEEYDREWRLKNSLTDEENNKNIPKAGRFKTTDVKLDSQRSIENPINSNWSKNQNQNQKNRNRNTNINYSRTRTPTKRDRSFNQINKLQQNYLNRNQIIKRSSPSILSDPSLNIERRKDVEIVTRDLESQIKKVRDNNSPSEIEYLDDEEYRYGV